MWPSFGWQARVPYGLRMRQDPTRGSCKTDDRLSLLLSSLFHSFSFKCFFSCPSTWVHLKVAFSSELFVVTRTSLCAAVITHSFIFLLLLRLLSFRSHLFKSPRHVTWLTVSSWRQTESPEATSWPTTRRPEAPHTGTQTQTLCSWYNRFILYHPRNLHIS